ncbi:dentin sialophosphoprotein-like [Branchiostoma lanceolatum]|uniref:dentin sialophosphoprotein-like n=1 Tax=Branchiostoma lanceolatum TaxID=7740 RepID=UPI003452E67D
MAPVDYRHNRWWFEVENKEVYVDVEGEHIRGEILHMRGNSKQNVLQLETKLSDGSGLEYYCSTEKFIVEANYFCKNFRGHCDNNAAFLKKWNEVEKDDPFWVQQQDTPKRVGPMGKNATGKSRDPATSTTSNGKPDRSTTSNGKPDRTTTSNGKPDRSTTSNGKPDRSTTSNGNPDRSTTSNGKPDRSTTSNGKPDRSTTSNGKPDRSTTSNGKPDRTTTSNGKPDRSTTSNGKPDRTTTSNGKPDRSTTSNGKPDRSTTSNGKSDRTTTSNGKPDRSTTSNGKPDRSTTSNGKPDRTTTSNGKPDRSTTSNGKPDRTTTSNGKPDRSTTSNGKPDRSTTSNGKPDRSTTSNDDATLDKGDILVTLERYWVGSHKVPIDCLMEPAWMRLVRTADPQHVQTLKSAFLKSPGTTQTVLAGNIVGLSATDFDKNKMRSYRFEVLGGNHTRQALQEILETNPDALKSTYVHMNVYCNLTEDLAKRVGIDHNKVTNNLNLSKPETYMEKLQSFRASLYYKAGYTRRQDIQTNEPPKEKATLAAWKRGLEVILACDTRKKLNDNHRRSILLASMPCNVWQGILSFAEMWEQGAIVGQRKGSRSVKQWHFDFIDKKGMTNEERDKVLQKLINGEASFDDVSPSKGKEKGDGGRSEVEAELKAKVEKLQKEKGEIEKKLKEVEAALEEEKAKCQNLEKKLEDADEHSKGLLFSLFQAKESREKEGSSENPDSAASVSLDPRLDEDDDDTIAEESREKEGSSENPDSAASVSLDPRLDEDDDDTIAEESREKEGSSENPDSAASVSLDPRLDEDDDDTIAEKSDRESDKDRHEPASSKRTRKKRHCGVGNGDDSQAPRPKSRRTTSNEANDGEGTSGKSKTSDGKRKEQPDSDDFAQANQNTRAKSRRTEASKTNYKVGQMVVVKGKTEDGDPVPWFARIVATTPLKLRYYDITRDNKYVLETDDHGRPIDAVVSLKRIVATATFNADMTLPDEELVRIMKLFLV